MQTREYKDTGHKISLLGFGTMRLPRLHPDGQEIDWPAAEKLIDYAYAHGVNYFDTAYMYHNGESERFIGHALKKYPRESFYLADKMPSWMAGDMAGVDRIFHEQLQRCGVDYFDFYLCHSLTRHNFDLYNQIDIYGYLAEKKKQGYIRQLGFSFHDGPEMLETLINKFPWDFAQLQLNYLDWDLQDAKRLYEILETYNLPCIVMEPVRGGALATLCPEAVDIFKTAAPDKSTASWAIRFAASLPNVMTVLSGMSDEAQVQDNIRTMTDFQPLTETDHRIIEKAVRAYQDSKTVPCTGCRYCMDCPSGVDIPLLFTAYNQFMRTENRDVFLQAYQAAGETKQAHRCVSCGVCASHCPQAIEIPEKIRQVAELYQRLKKD